MTDHRAIGRRNALEYRIWAVAAPEEWNITCADIADRLGEPLGRVAVALRDTGWHTRTRHVESNSLDTPLQSGFMSGFDGPARLERGDMDGVA